MDRRRFLGALFALPGVALLGKAEPARPGRSVAAGLRAPGKTLTYQAWLQAQIDALGQDGGVVDYDFPGGIRFREVPIRVSSCTFA